MKKLLSLALTFAMATSFVGCASSEEPADTTGGTETTGTESSATTEWPNGPVTVNVAAKAGGGTDIYTRLFTTPWQEAIGEGVAVVNFDNSAVSYQTTSDAKPDGQTLLTAHTGIICQYVTGGTQTNPLEDLEVAAAMQNMGNQALVVPVDAPYDNFQEMVDYAKAHPGEVKAGIQTGGTSHFIFGLIEQETGVEFKFVEAANETEKLTNIAGGFIDIANCTVANTESYEADGKLKVIGLITADGENIEGKPSNWDSIQNQGYPNVAWGGNIYVFAPKGTDEATLEAINSSLAPIAQDPSYIEGTEKIGGIPEYYNLADSQALFASEFEKINEIGTNLGISVLN